MLHKLTVLNPQPRRGFLKRCPCLLLRLNLRCSTSPGAYIYIYIYIPNLKILVYFQSAWYIFDRGLSCDFKPIYLLSYKMETEKPCGGKAILKKFSDFA